MGRPPGRCLVLSCSDPPTFSAPDAAFASAWLERARQARRDAALSPGLEHALQALALARDDEAAKSEAAFLACFFHFRLGHLPELLQLGGPTLQALKAAGTTAPATELLRWMTLAACEQGHFDQALQLAAEGCAQAQRGDDLAEQALSLNAMGACFERIGDPWQAERLMQEGLALAERHGGVYPRLASLNNLSAIAIGAFHLLSGGVDPDGARAALQRSADYARRAQPLLPALADPFFAVFIDGNLGEALLHLGQLDEAEAMLERALQTARQHGFTAQSRRIRCSMAEGLCARGRHAQARELMQEVWAEGAQGLPQATLIRLHLAWHRACRALGLTEEALDHHEQAEVMQRQRAARQLRAQSELLVTRVEAEQIRLQAEKARLEAKTERARAAELALHAAQDPLTGLGNRRYLDQRLPALLQQAEATRLPLGLALLDIDHFKRINDRHGHLCGDEVLSLLAQMLRDNTRADDLLARIGGEEFLIVLPHTDQDRAIEVCSRLRQRVAEQDWGALAAGLQVTLSIGLAQAPRYEMDSLFARADRALYRAKQAGRNRVRRG